MYTYAVKVGSCSGMYNLWIVCINQAVILPVIMILIQLQSHSLGFNTYAVGRIVDILLELHPFSTRPPFFFKPPAVISI